MTAEDRLIADLQQQRFADLTITYLDAVALVTAFAETAGEPTLDQIRAVIGHHEPQAQLALTAACRLSWQLLVGLAGAVNQITGVDTPHLEIWRSILEHRARNGAGDRPELFPYVPGWPT